LGLVPVNPLHWQLAMWKVWQLAIPKAWQSENQGWHLDFRWAQHY
jgi:hypothetical protein